MNEPRDKTPGWGALDEAGRVLRPRAAVSYAYEHLSDEQLLAELDKARRGEPSDVAPYPPMDPSTPTGCEHLTDDELIAELLRTRMAALRSMQPR
jgi:hypothetical protein